MKKLILLSSIIMLAMAGKTLGQPSSLHVQVIHIDSVLCYGQLNGGFTIVISGGTPPYYMDSIPVQDTATKTGFPAGTFMVNVYDSVENIAHVMITIPQPNPLNVVLTQDFLICFDSANIYTSVSGGTPPYSYHWSNGDSTQNITNLTGGLYTVTVTDHNGCTDAHDIFFSQPSPLDVHIDSLDVLCRDSCDGEITSAVTGGTPFSTGNYHYSWSNGQTTENINRLCPGIYDLTVTDSSGCQIVHSIHIGIKTNVVASFTASPTTGYAPWTVNFTYIGTTSSSNIYFWTFGNPGSGTSDTSFLSSPSHTFVTYQTYDVWLHVTDSACESSAHLFIGPLSINVETGINNMVSVYPNPVTDNLQIQTSLQIKDIEITDITGRLLCTTNAKTINCSNFAKGVYFITLTTEKGKAVKKFIKE